MAAFLVDAAAAGVALAGTTEGARPAADRTDGQATMHDVTSNVARVSSTPPIPNSRLRIFSVQKQKQCAMGKVRHIGYTVWTCNGQRQTDPPATVLTYSAQHRLCQDHSQEIIQGA